MLRKKKVIIKEIILKKKNKAVGVEKEIEKEKKERENKILFKKKV
jgi:hypothetical protein